MFIDAPRRDFNRLSYLGMEKIHLPYKITGQVLFIRITGNSTLPTNH
ncbi:hypothetical protein HMPREF3038_02423 [Akkermansia sp. KLE1797]|nr:hypothetical protein HMPREF3038_02423 [Akkermansia sp. KLE1797]KXU54845.1 hypothetical protein HMPREF3039_00992 [Akkermansia sp. KLE1798]KZA06229.1 hypothetical protein HMPREF1326_00077 [Akkermansia sp. KLE1605]